MPRAATSVAVIANEEVDMIDKITKALAVALVLASAGVASAQPITHVNPASVFAPPSNVESYYNQDSLSGGQYCYLPSEPCDNDHRMAN
jgi:hypothetical protein